jgi:uncharacterized membrane protein YqjE
MSKPTVIDVSKDLQRIAGFVIGFIFQGLVAQKLVEIFESTGGTIPTQIPMLTSLFLAGGVIGLVIFIIIAILAIKLVSKFLTFGVWILIGVLTAVLYIMFAPQFGVPNIFDWITNIFNL